MLRIPRNRAWDSDGKERRRTPRLSFTQPVHCGRGELSPATAVDLSVGGVAILFPEELEPGMNVDVAFLNRSVRVRGAVRRLQKQPDGQYHVGIMFDGDDPELVEVLRQYLNLPSTAGVAV